ncbi:hypothetical protein FB45DRAFT_836370 [Roridomyces roridus]|uniref:BTB domain-containing protein n=1 Tax=Roridomyces roridus TaxID=1738132 RepID=A0AAD7BNY2_9AGAR|nr:hypothetical protein FB45DRAFT_836370 [Roridomyces roridus]
MVQYPIVIRHCGAANSERRGRSDDAYISGLQAALSFVSDLIRTLCTQDTPAIEDQANAFTRVADLWFSDGSLVIRAQDREFFVSGAVLAARSSVFSDILSMPQRASNSDEMPIVVLPDNSREVESFLRAIFDSSFFMPPPPPAAPGDLLGIARLSHKYDIQYLFRRALDHLARVYPDDLSSFLTSARKFHPGLYAPASQAIRFRRFHRPPHFPSARPVDHTRKDSSVLAFNPYEITTRDS